MLALTSVLTVVWLVVFGGAVADALAAIGDGHRPGDRRLTPVRCRSARHRYHRLSFAAADRRYGGAALDWG